jgi:hypothetical protein
MYESAFPYGVSVSGVETGSWPFALLPYVEQDNMRTACLSNPLKYSYSYSSNYTYNGQSYPYSYSSSQTYPGSSGYQAQNGTGKLKPYWSKLDPTADSASAPCSYSMNGNLFGEIYSYGTSTYTYGYALIKITDGTSNTLMFGESYSRCATVYTYPGVNESFGYDRLWNYDPNNSSSSGTEIYNSNPYQFTYNSSGTTYPSFYSYGTYNPATGQSIPFEVQPKVTGGIGSCNYSGIQGGTAGGALVSMCDASVRFVSQSISLSSWSAVGTPQSGDVPGSDW